MLFLSHLFFYSSQPNQPAEWWDKRGPTWSPIELLELFFGSYLMRPASESSDYFVHSTFELSYQDLCWIPVSPQLQLQGWQVLR